MKFKEKIQPFLIGSLVGFSIACVLFLFRIDGYFSKIASLSLKNWGNVSEERLVNDIDSLQITESKAISNTKPYTKENSKFQNVNFATDKLIDMTKVDIKEIVDEAKFKNLADSLLYELSEVEETETSKNMDIEFWQSAFNTKGYKMYKNKIQLFGFKEYPVSMRKKDDIYYLRTNTNNIYQFSYTSDMKPLQLIGSKDELKIFN
jgi:hypothetical protein